MTPLHKKTLRFHRISITDDNRVKKSVNEHRAIGQAIIDGDEALACRLMEEHISNAKINMIERLNENG